MTDIDEDVLADLTSAITRLDIILGDTDGDGVDACPQHGPPAFRAIRALLAVTGDVDRNECACGDEPQCETCEFKQRWSHGGERKCHNPLLSIGRICTQDDGPAPDWCPKRKGKR